MKKISVGFKTTLGATTVKFDLEKLKYSMIIKYNDYTTLTHSISRDGFEYSVGQIHNNGFTTNQSLLITPKPNDIIRAGAIIGGAIIIAGDIITAPSGEGAIGVRMLQYGLGL